MRMSEWGRAKNVYHGWKHADCEESKHYCWFSCKWKLKARSDCVQCHWDDMMAHDNPDTGQRSAMTFGVIFGLSGYGHPLQRPVMQKTGTQHSLNNHSTGTGAAGCRNQIPSWSPFLPIPSLWGRWWVGEGGRHGALLKREYFHTEKRKLEISCLRFGLQGFKGLCWPTVPVFAYIFSDRYGKSKMQCSVDDFDK